MTIYLLYYFILFFLKKVSHWCGMRTCTVLELFFSFFARRR